jgi:hypothetical protein
LSGRYQIRYEAEASHCLVLVATTNRAPELGCKLADIDDCGDITNDNDHERARALRTTVAISELMTMFTPAATATGTPCVPMPYTSSKALKTKPVP